MNKTQRSFLHAFRASSRPRDRHRARCHRSRPRLEFLEDRRLLATSVATFEDLGLAANSFDNNAGSSGQFVDAGDSFNNDFTNEDGGLWSGWTISSTTDTTTPGFTNQYSAITGLGADGSPTYAVAFPFDSAADPFHPADSFVNLASGTSPMSIQVTNTTYAYLSMLNGDSFEGKFGPGDFFLLTVAGYTGPEGTGTKVGEVDFYLANFMGSNDTIVNTWQTVNLSSLAGAASLQFGLESSMNDPIFGLDTPAYVAVDNLTVATSARTTGAVSGVVYNDLNDDGVQDNGEGGLQNWVVQLYNGSTLVATSSPTDSNGNYSISGVAPGTYTLREVPQTGYTQTAPAAPGTFSVTITAGGSVTGDNFGNIAPVLTGIAVTPVDPSVPQGFAEQFTATGTYSNDSTANLTSQVTWASATPTTATITTAGLATGVATGTATISATLNGVSGSTALTVTAPLASIAVTPADPSVAAGRSQQFTATGTFADNSTEDLTGLVTWTSDTPSVATISSSGLAAGVATGPATISATLNGVGGSTVLTVTAPSLVSIAVTSSSASVAAGLTQQFTATGTYSDDSTADLTGQVSWSSATPSVATISSSGLAAGVATGPATIAATLSGVSGSTVLTVTAPLLDSIAVTPPDPSLATGLTQQFTATGTYSDHSTQNLTNQVTWASATPSLASITAAGLAMGVAQGPATISASLSGVSNTTVLTVTAPALVSIAVTPPDPSVAAGLTEQFTATGTYSDHSTQDLTSQVTWASAALSAASITPAGLATGVAIGPAAISATLNGVTGSTVLTVTAALLSSIAVTPSSPSLAKGLTQQFTATGTYTDNSTQNLTSEVAWTSGTPSVATITPAGLATSVGTGTSKISATLNGVTGSTVLTEQAASLVSIAVAPASPSLAAGLTQQLTATGTYSDHTTHDLTSAVAWSSDTPPVATITAAGLATGVTLGPATISATLSGVSGTTVLTVTAALLSSIAVTPSSPNLAKGLTQPFTATGTYTDRSTQDLTSAVTWSSDTPSVATISAAGLAMGVAPGTATISAALSGVTASSVLTVTPAALVSIAVTPPDPSLVAGLTEQLTATGTYSDNSTRDLTPRVSWSSDTPSVTVFSGLAAGAATGPATILATLNGVTGSTVLTVTAATLVSIAVTPSNPSLAKGLSQQFTATGTYSDFSTQNLTSQVTWSSATPSVATITPAGSASGVAPGRASISAILNGVSGSTRLTVTAAAAVPMATSPVTITSLRVAKVSLGTKHHVKKALVLVVQFSGALGTTAAQNLAAYTDFSGKIKKVHKISQIIYNKSLPLTQAIYNSSGNSVMLVPVGKPKLPKLEQLQVNVSLLTDPLGRPIDQGTNFKATVTNTGLVISSSLSSAASAAPAAAAVDALFEQGLVSSARSIH